MERLLLVLVLSTTVLSQTHVVVNVPGLGEMRGSTNTSLWTGRTIYQFQGIPYAKPPSKERRFKEPEPAEKWSGVLDATKFKRKCPQMVTEQDMIDIKNTMAVEDLEDCLYLNVYTTQIPGSCKKLLPVMFYMHGGSFRIGSAHKFRPNHLLEKDVVLVVIQYRLGPFGFLSLQNEDIAGNMGLLDMILALEWVNKHISQFCGDPNQVTIYGQSSGGGAVTLMLVSPLAKGLFTKAIMQSGSGLCGWAIDNEPVKHAKQISNSVNCTGSTKEIYECLKKATVYDLLMAHSNFLAEALMREKDVIKGTGGNHAVVQVAGNKKFITESPTESYLKGKFYRVPLMTGITRDEGTFIVGNLYEFILESNLTGKDKYIKEQLIATSIKFAGVDDETGLITDIFREYFFKEEQIGNFMEMVPGLVDLVGSLLLKSCLLKQARIHSKYEKTYLYSFNYKGHITKFGYGLDVHYPFDGGVAHSDELVYLYPDDSGELTANEKDVAKTVVDLWTNFAMNGTPAPAFGVNEFPAMENQNGPYLIINSKSSVEKSFVDAFTATSRESFGSSIRNTISTILLSLLVILNLV